MKQHKQKANTSRKPRGQLFPSLRFQIRYPAQTAPEHTGAAPAPKVDQLSKLTLPSRMDVTLTLQQREGPMNTVASAPKGEVPYGSTLCVEACQSQYSG